MKKKPLYKLFFFTLFLSASYLAQSQRDIIRDIGGRLPTNTGGSTDSLKRRDRFEDSITIRYRYLDTAVNYSLDSNITDFYRRFPTPPTHHYLGNPGTAARSMLFTTSAEIGWDAGFHSFDIYRFSMDKVRLFTTTRPYTELGYVLGSQTQQILEVMHTQNLRPNLNIGLQYRLINSPGFFKNQSTNHNNYLFTSWYQSKNKRYNNFLVLLGNKLQSEENGGIKTDRDYLNDPVYADRFGVPTKLGINEGFSRNFLTNELLTGTRVREFQALMRQQYDLGKKDSLVTDSTVIPLFYPRIRFEHTLRYATYRYQFRDFQADSAYYKDNYDVSFASPRDSILLNDQWREWKNDFSIYTFPSAQNLQQFFKVGIEYQLLAGDLQQDDHTFYNVSVHGEYRNRTRNKKWDMLAFGNLYLTGLNAGDYKAHISLRRLISNDIGSLQVGFENINRSPSFNYDERSQFYLDQPTSFSKENTTHLFARADNAKLGLQLGADYYLVGNYLYLADYYKLRQESSLFNVLRLSASKHFKLGKRLNWYADVYLQQKTGNVDLNFPLFLTRNRLLYEGNFGFKNLHITFGPEIRYHTPYKADHYSPVLGQFAFQDTTTIRNRPDIHALIHFRIRSFKAYTRFENLNTLRFEDGLEFKRHNFGAPDYPYPGLVLRFGVFWSFVN